jgi:hypothetical protein
MYEEYFLLGPLDRPKTPGTVPVVDWAARTECSR